MMKTKIEKIQEIDLPQLGQVWINVIKSGDETTELFTDKKVLDFEIYKNRNRFYLVVKLEKLYSYYYLWENDQWGQIEVELFEKVPNYKFPIWTAKDIKDLNKQFN